MYHLHTQMQTLKRPLLVCALGQQQATGQPGEQMSRYLMPRTGYDLHKASWAL